MKFLKSFRNNQKLRQITRLLSANVIGIPLGIIASIFVTKYLGPEKFGDYMFIQNIFNFAIIIGTFGFFNSGNRAIINSKKKSHIKEYYGAEIVISIFLFLFIALAVIFFISFDKNIQSKQLFTTILMLVPFVFVYLFVRYFETLLQADNRINLLIKIRLYPKVLFAVSIICAYLLQKEFSGSKLLIAYYLLMLSQLVVFVYVILSLKPSFKNLRKRIKDLVRLNKYYGWHVYIGSVFAVGFAQLSGILISYFGVDNTGVGYYALAITIAAPLSFIPNTIATTHYREFSIMSAIPQKVMHVTLAMSVAALLLSWLLIDPFINYFYGEDYQNVIPLFYIVSLGVCLHGLADFFNRFLGSHGQGKMLRNSSFIIGFCLLVMSVLLIPLWNEVGAAITKGATGLVYLVSIKYFYNKFKKSKC
jgi:O-antigen/teichoic acid export membrane protein